MLKWLPIALSMNNVFIRLINKVFMCVSVSVFSLSESQSFLLCRGGCVSGRWSGPHTHKYTYTQLTLPEGLIIGPPPVVVLPLRGIHTLTQHASAGLLHCVCECVCINFTCHAEKSCTGQLFLSLNLYLHFYWHSWSQDGGSVTHPPPPAKVGFSSHFRFDSRFPVIAKLQGSRIPY